MSDELLTDAKAAELLNLLVLYALDSESRGESSRVPSMTVAELAGDLIDSLPRLQPGLPTSAELHYLQPDSLTRSDVR